MYSEYSICLASHASLHWRCSNVCLLGFEGTVRKVSPEVLSVLVVKAIVDINQCAPNKRHFHQNLIRRRLSSPWGTGVVFSPLPTIKAREYTEYTVYFSPQPWFSPWFPRISELNFIPFYPLDFHKLLNSFWHLLCGSSDLLASSIWGGSCPLAIWLPRHTL